MPERKDEAYCRRSFERWLSVQYPNMAQEWSYEPNGRRTPDYHLRLGDWEYAVEVTRIAEGRDITAWFSFKRICKEIESEARAAGVLNGYHVLSFYSPVTTTAALRKSIQEEALEYIAAHRDDEAAAIHVIVADDRSRKLRRVAIQKLALGKDVLECLPGGRAFFESELHARVTSIMHDAIVRKHRRFEEVRETLPRILMLGHDLPVPSAATYRLCLQPLASEGLLDGFAAVFLAVADKTGEMLHESAGCFPPRT